VFCLQGDCNHKAQKRFIYITAGESAPKKSSCQNLIWKVAGFFFLVLEWLTRHERLRHALQFFFFHLFFLVCCAAHRAVRLSLSLAVCLKRRSCGRRSGPRHARCTLVVSCPLTFIIIIIQYFTFFFFPGDPSPSTDLIASCSSSCPVFVLLQFNARRKGLVFFLLTGIFVDLFGLFAHTLPKHVHLSAGVLPVVWVRPLCSQGPSTRQSDQRGHARSL